jgi:hypothetical protein
VQVVRKALEKFFLIYLLLFASADAEEIVAPGVTMFGISGLSGALVTYVVVDHELNEVEILTAISNRILKIEAGIDCNESPSNISARQIASYLTFCVPELRTELRGRQHLPEALFIDDFFIESGAVIALSGGYMSSFSPPIPLGYLRSEGMNFGEKHESWLTAGVFCVNSEKAEIREMKSASMIEGDCLQAGPIIVRNGINRYSATAGISIDELRLVNSVQEQAFVCINMADEIILGISEPIGLREFSSILVGDVGCVDALRLSGQNSAGLALTGRVLGSRELPLHNAIGVFPKSGAE